jgi:hypothetical protein
MKRPDDAHGVHKSASYCQAASLAYASLSRRWDSNPQPAVYKTAALPLELRRLTVSYTNYTGSFAYGQLYSITDSGFNVNSTIRSTWQRGNSHPPALINTTSLAGTQFDRGDLSGRPLALTHNRTSPNAALLSSPS